MATQAAKGSKGYPQPVTYEKENFASTYDFLLGYVPDADPAQIPLSALTIASNATFIRNMLFRRNGVNQWPTTKPNSNKVMAIFPFFEPTTGLSILRFTRNTIHKATSAGWTPITPSGIPAMTGTDEDYFSFAVIDNRMFFTNGVDPIRELDIIALTYKQLGNAPSYKYITAAFNRIVGVNLTGVSPETSQVGWSGESNYAEWNPLVDISAGSQILTSSPNNLIDDCTGVFFTGNVLIVPRQQSIWMGTHTPSATNPFQFFVQIPTIGADVPRTIKLTDYGLVWLSNQTSHIYVWTPGSAVGDPDSLIISRQISRALRMKLNSANAVWADYGQEGKIYDIYTLGITSQSAEAFEYNFATKAWTTNNVGSNPTTTFTSNYANSSTTIDDLLGTINSLVGTIDSLGGLQQNSTRIFGFLNGELGTEQLFSGLSEELSNISVTDLANAFETEFRTKILEAPPDDTYLTLIRAMIYPYTIGSITLERSKDDGNTWTVMKTYVVTEISKQQFIQVKKVMKARRYQWRIKTSNCMFAFAGFFVRALSSGVSNTE